MFGRKKDAAKISGKSPVFHVRLIGRTETYVATGRGCSYAPVQRLWDNSAAERNMRKVAVNITPMGLSLRDVQEKSPPPPPPPQKQQRSNNHNNNHNNHQQQQQQQQQQKQPHNQHFDIEDISFCNVDRAVNERIFSWIYKNRRLRRLDCYAVLCSTAQKAQTMAIVLSRAFQIAYKDWRAHHREHETTLPSSQAPSTSAMNSLSDVKDSQRSNTSPSSPVENTSPPTSQLASFVASSIGRNEDRDQQAFASDNKVPVLHHIALPQSGLETHTTPFSHHHLDDDDESTVTSAGDVNPASPGGRTALSVQQSGSSSSFGSSRIWDPEMDDLVGEVNSLQADLDLEDHGSY